MLQPDAISKQAIINLEATCSQTRCNLCGLAISKFKATCKSIRLSVCIITTVDNMYDWDLVTIWWWLSNGSIFVFPTYSEYASNCINHISNIYRSSNGTILTCSGQILPATTRYDPLRPARFAWLSRFGFTCNGSHCSHGSVWRVTVRIVIKARCHISRFAWFDTGGRSHGSVTYGSVLTVRFARFCPHGSVIKVRFSLPLPAKYLLLQPSLAILFQVHDNIDKYFWGWMGSCH